MSKLSDYHAELEEQAAELGFESLQQAQDAGCEVEWHKDSAELVEPLVAAHRAWEEGKEDALTTLQAVKEEIIKEHGMGIVWVKDIEDVYDWIEKEAHE